MMVHAEKDEQIDYTNYLRDKPRETDTAKIEAMRSQVLNALYKRGLRGAHLVQCDCCADGHVKVTVNGEYYGVFDCNTGKFFSGYPGD